MFAFRNIEKKIIWNRYYKLSFSNWYNSFTYYGISFHLVNRELQTTIKGEFAWKIKLQK